MGRAFSLPSSGLRYLLGYSLVHAERVAICSPWLSDVELRMPLCPAVEDRRPSLSNALELLETRTDVFVRAGESHNDYVRARLERIPTVRIQTLDDLHAKSIVTDEYVYVGSANITQGGFLTNRELCEVVENDYGDVDDYLAAELDLEAPR